jgi:hypothetical protein
LEKTVIRACNFAITDDDIRSSAVGAWAQFKE